MKFNKSLDFKAIFVFRFFQCKQLLLVVLEVPVFSLIGTINHDQLLAHIFVIR